MDLIVRNSYEPGFDMRFGWDETKRRQNLKSHGVDFRAAYHFEWHVADVTIDDRVIRRIAEVATSSSAPVMC
jgi:uncharacterized DUF497 family protein